MILTLYIFIGFAVGFVGQICAIWFLIWWESRPMSKKQAQKCIEWETKNKYL